MSMMRIVLPSLHSTSLPMAVYLGDYNVVLPWQSTGLLSNEYSLIVRDTWVVHHSKCVAHTTLAQCCT